MSMLLTLIYASCRDCPSYLASAETVHDLLLPAETVVLGKWIPAEIVRVILLPADNLCRKRKLADSIIPCDNGGIEDKSKIVFLVNENISCDPSLGLSP